MHDLLLLELVDVEYYRDLEMQVKGHPRALKTVSFETLGTVSYSLSTHVLELYTKFNVSPLDKLHNQKGTRWSACTSNKVVPILKPRVAAATGAEYLYMGFS